jgi:hypothetical protein
MQVINVILWKECGNQKVNIISLQYFLLIFCTTWKLCVKINTEY